MCESSIVKAFHDNKVPLIYGDSGIGKTIYVKKLIKKVNNSEYNYYLSCPIEKEDIINVYHAIQNDPKRGLIIDNLESADSKCIKNVISLIKKKHKSTIIILVCLNPYADNLKLIKRNTISVLFDMYDTITIMNFAKKRKSSEYTLSLIKNNNLTDLRLIKHMCLFKSEKYDKDTYTAQQNPFKGIEYLFGCKNDANLEYLVNSNREFYKFGILSNYCKSTNDISSIEKYSKYLSDIDLMNYEATDIQNSLLSNLHKINKKKRKFRITFPKFSFSTKLRVSNTNLLPNCWFSIEHRDSILNIINDINNSKSVSTLQKNYISMIKNKYNLSFEFIEKQYRLSHFKKLKAIIKNTK